MLKVEQISKIYRTSEVETRALQDISFEIRNVLLGTRSVEVLYRVDELVAQVDDAARRTCFA